MKLLPLLLFLLLLGGCYERIIDGALNAIREWDVAGACPASSFSLRLRWGLRRYEVERPCAAPLFLVTPAQQLPPLEEG